MLLKFKQHIHTSFPFLKGKKLLIAISGGLDSVVLSELLYELKIPISLVHCNFQLRGTESDLDAEFVNDFAKNKKVTIFTKKFNTKTFSKENKQSTQVAARNLRYTWFTQLATEHSFDYVLTAHHADDNLETFLINLSRGTGLEGLTGIPTVHEKIVRPLLPFSRKEIQEYAAEKKLTWREDQSNSEIKYLRNKIRHQIVPELKKLNPSLLNSFSKTILYLQESTQIIEDRMQDVATSVLVKENDITKIDIEILQKLSNPKAYLYQFLKNFGFTEWNDIVHLVTAQSGKQIFSKTHRLLKDRKFLILFKKDTETKNTFQHFLIPKEKTEISTPISLKIEAVTQSTINKKNAISVDAALLQFPLTLRKWEHGDSFYPLGMQGKKKISKYFKDKKLSLLEKENIWLLCTAKNKVIWIINHRQDARFTPNKSTTNYLKITTK